MAYDINNRASYDYLEAFRALSLPSAAFEIDVYAPIVEFLQTRIQTLAVDYDENLNYKELYTQLHLLAETVPLVNPKALLEGDGLKTFHCQFFKSLYENDSKLHEKIHSELGMSHDAPPAPRTHSIQNIFG